MLYAMYRSVLAALLFGMLPLSFPAAERSPVPLGELAVAPPAISLEITERLSASGVVILDARSGQRLYSKQLDTQRPMASLTKLMTALLIVENHSLDEWVRVMEEAQHVNGNNTYLPAGEQFTVGDLLSALLIASANDAAYVLAVYHSGSLEAFVDEMNHRAETLGLKNTNYTNPTGLDNSHQVSTPQDVSWLSVFALRNPEIRGRMGRRGERIFSRSGVHVDLANTHELIHKEVSVVAGKTGTTDGAKECLLSVVASGGREYIVVLMHSAKRYADMGVILDAVSGRNPESGIQPASSSGGTNPGDDQSQINSPDSDSQVPDSEE